MAGTDLASAASATGQIDDTDSGLEITLNIQGLPPAPDGYFYEAWMRTANDDDPDLTAIGTFHMRGGGLDGHAVVGGRRRHPSDHHGDVAGRGCRP